MLVKIVQVDLKKLSHVVSKEVVKKTKFMTQYKSK